MSSLQVVTRQARYAKLLIPLLNSAILSTHFMLGSKHRKELTFNYVESCNAHNHAFYHDCGHGHQHDYHYDHADDRGY